MPPQFAVDGDEFPAALRNATSELFDLPGERPILSAHQVEVLVAAQQIAEALRGEQHLEDPQRSPLVDLHQSGLEHRPLLGEGVLGQHEVDGDGVQLGAQRADLAVELVDDARRRRLLPVDVIQFL